MINTGGINMKRIISFILCAVLVCAAFAGCSSNKNETYGDTVLIIGYTESEAPFLEVDADGNATGFYADLWASVFESVKGDFKSYRFEKIEKGYILEESGGFTDSKGKAYSASLLMGAVMKNEGTVNEDYSFTEPIITNRVIAVTAKDSGIKSFADFSGKKAVTVNALSKAALEKQSSVATACASVSETDIENALKMLDGGAADVVITDEFTFMPLANASAYTVLGGELDTVEYVIACAKYSGWKDSINEAIYEYKNPEYNKNGDEFTPLVEKYFGYNASSFDYQHSGK